MNRHIAFLVLMGALIYGTAAYTRPHEPAGRWLHQTAIPAVKEAMPECPRIPFSGLLKWEDDHKHKTTRKPKEVVPATATPYTHEELAEIYPTH